MVFKWFSWIVLVLKTLISFFTDLFSICCLSSVLQPLRLSQSMQKMKMAINDN